jgi:uncharacterized protein YbjT (DUF2867 family)
MVGKTATLIGATGLIGNELREMLATDPYYQTIRILSRRPLDKKNEREEIKLINFQDPESFKLGIEGSDAVFVTVGTTNRKVKGDKTAYRKVDFDIPVNAARFCTETGCDIFLLVSSVGADSQSRNFYLRLKGETEEAISTFAIPAIHIMQPSMLLGKRAEHRAGEKITQTIMQTLAFLIPPKYRPISASVVANGLILASKRTDHGIFIYENPQIRKLLTDPA